MVIANLLNNMAEHALLERKAKLLSTEGWRFFRETGPNGIYYRGRGPHGWRMQSRASHDEREALKLAIEHAATFWRR